MFRKKEEGMITIEATIVLSIYLFAFLMIFDIVNLCRAQMKISVAINNVAKEISEYSYLYGLTGLNDSMGDVHNRAVSEKEDYSDIAGDIGAIYSSIAGIAGEGKKGVNLDSVKNIKNELSGVKGTAEGLKDKIMKKADSPKELMLGLCNILLSDTDERVKSVIAAGLAKAITKQNLKTASKASDADIENTLHRMGIKKTGDTYLDSIDFSHSRLFPGSNNRIEIVAEYELKVVPFLKIDTSFKVVQRAITRGWLKGDEDKK